MKKWVIFLIIALVIVFIVLPFLINFVLWNKVKNVVNEGSEQIALGKNTLDLQIEEVQIEGNQVNIKIKRDIGHGEFVGIKFIIEDGKNTEIIEKRTSLKELMEETFILNLGSIEGSDVTKILIVPVFRLESGEEIIGDVKDEYVVPKYY